MNRWQSIALIARTQQIAIASTTMRKMSMIPKSSKKVASDASWHGLTESTTHTRQMMVNGRGAMEKEVEILSYGFYDRTMERLSKIYPDRMLTDKDAVILLAQEIDDYRTKIRALEDRPVSADEMKAQDELRVCKSDNEMLKDVIIRLAMRLVGM